MTLKELDLEPQIMEKILYILNIFHAQKCWMIDKK